MKTLHPVDRGERNEHPLWKARSHHDKRVRSIQPDIRITPADGEDFDVYAKSIQSLLDSIDGEEEQS